MQQILSNYADIPLWTRASAEKFPGGTTKKRPKNSKKTKNNTIMPLPEGGGATKKKTKIVLFSLYLLNLYYV